MAKLPILLWDWYIKWLNSGFVGTNVLAERGMWDIMRTNPIKQDLFYIRRSGLLDSIIFWKVFHRGTLFQRYNSQIVRKCLLDNYANLAITRHVFLHVKVENKKSVGFFFFFFRIYLTTEVMKKFKDTKFLGTCNSVSWFISSAFLNMKPLASKEN